MIKQFEVSAKKYFENDPDRLSRVEEGDVCLVTIDFEKEKAEYVWYNPEVTKSEDRNPANFPSIEDDFDGVLELLEGI